MGTFTCKFCDTVTNISDSNTITSVSEMHLEDKDYYTVAKEMRHGAVFSTKPGTYKKLKITWHVCQNTECKQVMLHVDLFKVELKANVIENYDNHINTFQLIPKSHAKAYPDYVPIQIREDYEEACAILNDSPKSSATLMRRCLQGIIRDFWKIEDKKILRDEIDALKAIPEVDKELLSAIDSIRKVGNIGAHMEKDVNLILPITANEAKQLIDIVELLIEEWYVARENRRKKINNATQISKEKEDMKKK